MKHSGAWIVEEHKFVGLGPISDKLGRMWLPYDGAVFSSEKNAGLHLDYVNEQDILVIAERLRVREYETQAS